MISEPAQSTSLPGHALDRASGGRPVPGNAVRLLTDGPEIFPEALTAIERAQAWIHFDNYIFRPDRIGKQFADALIARAQAGVRVRVLTDWLGSAGTPRDFWDRLRRAGVEVRQFNPLRVLDLGANLTRNHRKMIVVDGSWALTGGFSIGDEWTGDPERGRQPWRETAVSIRGPAATVLDQAFAHAWAATGTALPVDELAGEVAPEGPSEVRVIAGVPGRDRALRVMDYLLGGSTRRYWVTDAYFVAPRRLFQSLLDAARDGVDVRLLVPGSSDLPLIRNLTRIGYRRLLRGGVRIYEWNGPMLHAKTVVADGRWARIGSSNLNPASLYGNWELDVLIDDPAFATGMEARFRRDLELSAEITLRPVLRKITAGPTRLDITRTSELPAVHRPGFRELRTRGVNTFRTLFGTARLATFGPLAVTALLVGVLLVLVPNTMAVVFAVLLLWVAVASGIQAIRRDRD